MRRSSYSMTGSGRYGLNGGAQLSTLPPKPDFSSKTTNHYAGVLGKPRHARLTSYDSATNNRYTSRTTSENTGYNSSTSSLSSPTYSPSADPFVPRNPVSTLYQRQLSASRDRNNNYKSTTDRSDSVTTRISDLTLSRRSSIRSPISTDLNLNTSSSYYPKEKSRSTHQLADENFRTSRTSTTEQLNRRNEIITASYRPSMHSETAPARKSYETDSSRSSNGAYSKYETRGLVGLKNLGNTCFMNSVLQCLSHTRPLMQYIVEGDYSREINTGTSSMRGALVKAYASVMDGLWSESASVVNPSAFKTQMQRFASCFRGYAQQDAQEFLRYLLQRNAKTQYRQGIHEDVNRVQKRPPPLKYDEAADDRLRDMEKAAEYWRRYLRLDSSRVVDMFVGQLKSTLECDDCGHLSTTFDPFWDLSLPVKNSRRLTDCFSLFMREETLDGDEMPKCGRCKTRRRSLKRFAIHRFPPILVIHLKRFSQGRLGSKLSSCVDFPLRQLDLAEFASPDTPSESAIYDLYGVCNHSGTMSFGHYTAYCRHAFTGRWHCFNDSSVSRIRDEDSIVSGEAYVLFYQQTNSTAALTNGTAA